MTASPSLIQCIRKHAEVCAFTRTHKAYMETLDTQYLPQVEKQREMLERALNILSDCYYATVMGSRDAHELSHHICNKVAPILREMKRIT